MKLIVDSGSTKSDWILISEGGNSEFSTIGFNPYFHNSTFISEQIKLNEEIISISSLVKTIHFYGAGCSSEARCNIVVQGLKAVFTNAQISVNHDLTACALATYKGESSISCILGTGSNSCLYDGENVTEVVPSLGYVLGDEGSGNYFGKKILTAYLYKQLPDTIHKDFVETYNLSKDDILETIYKKPNANRYIASFSKFMAKHKSSPFISEILVQGMKEFMKIHVCCFADHKQVKTHFIGSVAYNFQDEIKSAAKILGINVGSIIQKPIEGLVEYHTKELI